MSPRPNARLWIDVTLDARPVVGSVSSKGATTRQFSGWTELFASLDATLTALRTGAAQQSSRGAGTCLPSFERDSAAAAPPPRRGD